MQLIQQLASLTCRDDFSFTNLPPRRLKKQKTTNKAKNKQNPTTKQDTKNYLYINHISKCATEGVLHAICQSTLDLPLYLTEVFYVA